MYQTLAKARRNTIAQNLKEGEMLILFAGNDELGVCGISQRKNRDTNFFLPRRNRYSGRTLVLARIQDQTQEFLL